MKKIKVVFGLLAITCMVTWLISNNMLAGSTTPGSVEDPIVTKSYVDQMNGTLKQELNAVIDGLKLQVMSLQAIVNSPTNTTSTTTTTTTEPKNTVSQGELDAVYSYINQKVAVLDNSINTLKNSGTPSSENGREGASLFQVIEVELDQRVICGASAEVILRGGEALVVAGINGDGLADLTAGEDLLAGAIVPQQHHLLVSRDDGRGIQITAVTGTGKAYVLVKGDYRVE